MIEDGNQKVLFSGCSHNGIVNIIEEIQTVSSGSFTHVIGGFHLFNPISKKYEKDELIRDIAERLKQYNCKYYTCHCTGSKAYKKMKEMMGERLNYLSTGSRLEIRVESGIIRKEKSELSHIIKSFEDWNNKGQILEWIIKRMLEQNQTLIVNGKKVIIWRYQQT